MCVQGVLGHCKGVDKRVNLAQQVDNLIKQIVAKDLRDFVLVGHSYGGIVIARVAEEIPDRIRRLVFWNAFVPQAGNSLRGRFEIGCQACSSPSSAFASFRSSVSKPSSEPRRGSSGRRSYATACNSRAVSSLGMSI